MTVNTGSIRLNKCSRVQLFTCSAQITLTGVNSTIIKFAFTNVPSYASASQGSNFIHFGPDSNNSYNYSIVIGQTAFGIVKNSIWNDISGNTFTNNTRTRLVCYALFI